MSTSQWTISPPRDTRHTRLIPPSSSLSPPLYIFIALCLRSSLALWGHLADSDRTNKFVFVFSFFFLTSLMSHPLPAITPSPVAHKLVAFPPSRTSCQSRWALCESPSQFSARRLLLRKTSEVTCDPRVKPSPRHEHRDDRKKSGPGFAPLSSCAWACGRWREGEEVLSVEWWSRFFRKRRHNCWFCLFERRLLEMLKWSWKWDTWDREGIL